jgi:hypothetical protein
MAEDNTEEVKHRKLNASYRFDAFLMYLIQDVSKRSSAEIANFFYELSTQVCELGFAAKKCGGGIDKRINDYFPGTSIPFYMRVRGSQSESHWDYKTRQTIHKKTLSATIEVTFPESTTYMKPEELERIADEIMESKLLGVEEPDMAPFKRPELRTPKMYEDLMNSFAGRPAAEKKARKRKVKNEG